MKITLDSLLVLNAIHQYGSFAAAAEKLHRVPSAVTYTIKKLEQDLEICIFNRSGHRAVLTDAGQILLDEGRHLIDSVSNLENQLKKVSEGWETELHIAVADMLNKDMILGMIKAFYQQKSGTRIRLMTEVYGGTWDALISKRADLIIGAPENGPSGGGYFSRKLCRINWIFVISPEHPLANAGEPLTEESIRQHRAIAVSDTSRYLPSRTSGIFTGQDVFSVADFTSKIKAHVMGMGVGFLPEHLIQSELENGLLIKKQVETGVQSSQAYVAWRTGKVGRSLQWFLDRLDNFKLSHYKP